MSCSAVRGLSPQLPSPFSPPVGSYCFPFVSAHPPTFESYPLSSCLTVTLNSISCHERLARRCWFHHHFLPPSAPPALRQLRMAGGGARVRSGAGRREGARDWELGGWDHPGAGVWGETTHRQQATSSSGGSQGVTPVAHSDPVIPTSKSEAPQHVPETHNFFRLQRIIRICAKYFH